MRFDAIQVGQSFLAFCQIFVRADLRKDKREVRHFQGNAFLADDPRHHGIYLLPWDEVDLVPDPESISSKEGEGCTEDRK